MRNLTVWLGGLLAISLAAAPKPASAGDYSRGNGYSGSSYGGSYGGTVSSGYGGSQNCYRCPPPKNYDSQEVVKQTRDVNHDRVINTQSVVPSQRVIETNHLIVHNNETRNVG